MGQRVVLTVAESEDFGDEVFANFGWAGEGDLSQSLQCQMNGSCSTDGIQEQTLLQALGEQVRVLDLFDWQLMAFLVKLLQVGDQDTKARENQLRLASVVSFKCLVQIREQARLGVSRVENRRQCLLFVSNDFVHEPESIFRVLYHTYCHLLARHTLNLFEDVKEVGD